MKSLIQYLVGFIFFALVGCASHPIIMEAKDVKLSRDSAKPTCNELGPVQGKLIGTKPNMELAMEDMKKEAAAKGANYVKIESASIYGTAVRGSAYFCP
ncbi:MAG: hypothetical protein AABY64_04815 [Bdellovibrionota bacterium]